MREHMYGLRDQSALENHRTGTASYLIIVHSSFTYPLTGLSSVRCVKGTFHPCVQGWAKCVFFAKKRFKLFKTCFFLENYICRGIHLT